MSIQKKITLLFLSSLVLMSLIGFWGEKTSLQKAKMMEQSSYITSAKELFSSLAQSNRAQVEATINELGLRKIKDMSIVKKGEPTFYQEHTFGALKILKYSGKYYLYIKYLDTELLLYDVAQEESIQERYIANSLVSLDVILMFLIYLVVLKILSPLKHISQKMKEFSSGDLLARAVVRSKDEIGDVSHNFNAMATKLQEALDAREELLRDVGHELRTPIAKGKFALEGMTEGKEKEIIKKAFNDLDTLTSEILQMQLLSKDDLFEYSRFKAQTLITESLSKLHIENEDELQIEIEDFEIYGDLYYLTIALKNLLDNALKYSTSKPIFIEAKARKISIISSGAELEKGLEHYTQAFTRNNNLHEGFGIGLNIVSKIVAKHHFKLEYEYRDEKNIFTLIFIS